MHARAPEKSTKHTHMKHRNKEQQKQVSQLRKSERAKAYELTKSKRMQERQRTILKRKMEEHKAQTRRYTRAYAHAPLVCTISKHLHKQTHIG